MSRATFRVWAASLWWTVAAASMASPVPPIESEVERLRAEATETTRAIGELAQSGSLPTDEEAIALMRQLVDRLAEIQQRLQAIEAELAENREQRKDLQESQRALTAQVAEIRRFRSSLYMQFQFRNSDRPTVAAGTPSQHGAIPFAGGRESAFSMRRVRFGGTYRIDEQTSMRLGIEAASGTSQDQVQLRDTRLIRTLRSSETWADTELWVGQFNVPLGYENLRSSAEREFPEHAQYNRIMLAGEAMRGAMLQGGLGPRWVGAVGAFGSLTINDPEQQNRGSMPNGRAAILGSLRYEDARLEAGISHLEGDRPGGRTVGTPGTATVAGQTVVTPGRPLTLPTSRRSLTFLDATWVGAFAPNHTLRGELMWGRDRVPVPSNLNAGSSSDLIRVKAKPMVGWHLQSTWNLGAEWQLFARAESFDPDLQRDGDAIQGWGIGARRWFTPSQTLTFSVEQFRGAFFAPRAEHSVWTLRYQLRF